MKEFKMTNDKSIKIGCSIIDLKLIEFYGCYDITLRDCDFILCLGKRFVNLIVFHESFKTKDLAYAKYHEFEDLIKRMEVK